MTTLERGFKSFSERVSAAFRQELGLGPDGRLDPQQLAHHLGVLLWTPRDVPGIAEDVLNQLLENDRWGWSAVSLAVDGRSIVIYNPRKSEGRRASDIVHELAHIILEHRPATIIVAPDMELSMRSFDPKQEDEANWLAWSLLLPRDGLLMAHKAGRTPEEIAIQFGVTLTLANFRLQKTGVKLQASRRGLS